MPFRAWVNALILPITLYLFAVSFIFLTNAFLLGTYKHAFGHAGYTLLTAVGLAGFLYVFRKDRRDLAATLILYLLLNVPGAMMYWDADSNVRDVFDLPRSLTKNNCCAISLAVSIMFFYGIFVLFPEQIRTEADSSGFRSTLGSCRFIPACLHCILVVS